MARCRHGFEPAGPAGVKCPTGCHGPVPRESVVDDDSGSSQSEKNNHTRTITNEQIVVALNERGTLNAAAVQLGINPGTIVNRAKACSAVREALAGRDKRKTRHNGFVDMTGWEQDGWKVLGEAPSMNGNTRWRCQHKCGGVEIVEGIKLRNNPNKYCLACRPARHRAKEPCHG